MRPILLVSLLALSGLSSAHASGFAQACNAANDGSAINCSCVEKLLRAHDQKEYLRLSAARGAGNFTRYDEGSEFRLNRKIRDLGSQCVSALPSPGSTSLATR